MDRREFLKAAVLGAAAMAVPGGLMSAQGMAEAAEAAGKPNVIFILSDDVGLGDIGCFGSDRYKTPRIDSLAKGGLIFTHCYSEPLCGPSRCEIMTGRYPFRTGMISNQSSQALVPPTEVMMPKVLKPAGYATAQVGKWSQLPLEPADFGFDEYLRFEGSGFYWKGIRKGYTENGKQKDLGDKYMPDVMHDFLIDFITRHKDQPFYVYYPLSHIHGRIDRTPDSKPGSDQYADNIAYMDKLMGKLVDELDRLKLREKTLIIFVGDNGTAGGHADTSTVHGKRLSGQKGTMLEGGSRVPMIVSWPGTAPVGKTIDDLVDFSDYFPTIAEVAGAKLPAGVKIDGHSFADRIKGKAGNPREWLYVELNGNWYVRDKRYKLTGKGQLYDLKDAPFAEPEIPADKQDADALAAKKRLQAVLDELNPAAGNQKFKGTGKPRQQRRRQRQQQRANPSATGTTSTNGGAKGDSGLGALLGL